jgi:hypothetical protein
MKSPVRRALDEREQPGPLADMRNPLLYGADIVVACDGNAI